MSFILIQPCAIHGPFSALDGFVEFFWSIPFWWTQPWIIHEVKPRQETEVQRRRIQSVEGGKRKQISIPGCLLNISCSMNSFTYISEFPLKCTNARSRLATSCGIDPVSLLLDKSRTSRTPVLIVRVVERHPQLARVRNLASKRYQNEPFSFPNSDGIDWVSKFDEMFKTFSWARLPIAEGMPWVNLLPAKSRSEKSASLKHQRLSNAP